MSLYNMVIPTHPLAGYLLHHLGLKPAEVARLRDTLLVKVGDEYRVRVLTRTGGGNREYYDEANKKLQAHQLYISDADEPYDTTYANFDFKVPESVLQEFKTEGVAIDNFVDPLSFREKWELVLASMKADNERTGETDEEIVSKVLGKDEDGKSSKE